MAPQSQASANSAGSNKSKSAAVPRPISKGSFVDETLFGGKKKSAQSSTGSAHITKDQYRSIRDKTEKGQQADAVIITASELQKMKATTKIMTKEQELENKRLLEEQKDQQLAASKARKKRMLEMERDREKLAPLSQHQKDEKKKNETLLTKARDALDEELDDVKHMNQMVLYSKCVTVRDKQLEEQKYIEAEMKEEEKKLDLMMEIERLKALKEQEEREYKRKEAQRDGAIVIVDQIKEREKQRIREQEQLEKEKTQMLKQIEILKNEEAIVQKRKHEEGKKLLAEVIDANKNATVVKDMKKKEEIDLDKKIAEYNKQKAQREEEALAEQKRLHDEKEREVQRLREKQERAADKQAEVDALRAKRAFEESERQARLKEKKEAEIRAQKIMEMEEARHQQFLDKERRLGEQAKQERDEFLRIIQSQKEQQELERKLEEEKNGIMKKHAQQLRTQIFTNEDKERQEKLDYLEEGRKIRQKIEDEKQRLENIRKKKLEGLKDLSIPDKYQAELARKKIA